MAIRTQFWGGAEVTTGSFFASEFWAGANPATVETTIKHLSSSIASAKCLNSGGGQFASLNNPSWTAASSSNFMGWYMQIATLPTATHRAEIGGLHRACALTVDDQGNFQFWNNFSTPVALTTVGGSDGVLTTGVWHKIVVQYDYNGSAQLTGASVYVDDVLFHSGTFTAITLSGATVVLGNLSESGTYTSDAGAIYYDDWASWDTTANPFSNIAFTQATGFDWATAWMRPHSDAQAGSWTGGAGGTTNLWDAVDNNPPVGVANASRTNTSQITSVDSTGDNATDEYRANMGTLNSKGMVGTIGTSTFIMEMQIFIAHGEPVATGTKTGSYGFQSNPSQAAARKTITFGGDVGACGTYSTNWATETLTAIPGGSNAPTASEWNAVNPANEIIVSVRKTDAGTRAADICSLELRVIWANITAAAATDEEFPYAGGGYFPMLREKMKSLPKTILPKFRPQILPRPLVTARRHKTIRREHASRR